MLLGREIEGQNDPVRLARALAREGAPGVALLHSRASSAPRDLARWSFVAAFPEARSASLVPPRDGSDEPSHRLSWVPRWIGAVPYEARRSSFERPGWSQPDVRPAPPLGAARWYRYGAVACFDHREGRVLVAGTDRERIRDLAAFARAAHELDPGREALDVELSEPEAQAVHRARIDQARELIARGDLYQVNLARRLDFSLVRGGALGLYERLATRAPSAFGACLDLGEGLSIAGTSPELLLHTEVDARGARLLFTAPIKGTRPRGAHAVADRDLVTELDGDPKERAELAMILDVERNDLGRLAAAGFVRLLRGPAVESHRTVHHRGALLAARARPGVALHEIVATMVPSGSVTGAPKVRAMEVIASLEAARRGLYTGGLGFVRHSGEITLAMAIRVAVLDGPRGTYWTGGGIVADSDPGREVEETRWKARQILGSAS